MRNEVTEMELWTRFKNGDKESFKEIYYEHYMFLYNYGIKTTSENNLVEDCLQDLFLKLWKNRENLGEVISIKAYLYRAYVRILFDALKKSKRVLDFNELDGETETSSIEENIIHNQSQTEFKTQINKALNQLSKRHRQVLQLHYLDGLSYKQIEEILPIKYQAIRNYVHEGLKVMRKKMVS
ncbi:MAG: RNA polymerase sigma factor [Sphingobacteriaceae bacterium]|jgi:RNA polymerase sigma-70 factor (ECF subfamily)|nr:RNA polymerase sigma factor [Sphingobacteriaceae bacterium]